MNPTCLLIDAGNSQVKWQLCRLSNDTDDQSKTTRQNYVNPSVQWLTQGQTCYTSDLQTLTQLQRQWQNELADHVIDQVIVCSVTALHLDELQAAFDPLTLTTDVQAIHWQLFTTEAQSQIGRRVINGYHDNQQMGADRWANVLGACWLAPPEDQSLVIVSAGTPLTLDFVTRDTDWYHQGGLIIPGLQTLRTSLHEHTSALPALPVDETDLSQHAQPGRSTKEAIQHGTLNLTTALIEQCARDARVILTGGTSAILADYLRLRGQSVIVVPNLLSYGLLARHQMTQIEQ